MTRPKHIAVAIDFSGHSTEAAKLAYGLARAWESDLTLIHVFEPIGSHYPGSAALLPELVVDQIEESNRERGLARLQSLHESLEHGVIASERPTLWSVVVAGKPAEAICKIALEAAAELLVIGTRGKSQVRSWLLGSVVRDVAARAHCPVLATRGEHEPSWNDGFGRIVVGVDHTELTQPVIAASRSILADEGALAMVKVWDVPPFAAADIEGAGLKTTVDKLHADAINFETERLDEVRKAAGLSESDVTLHVEIGKPAQILLEQSVSLPADIIALGAHSRDSVFDKVLGTTAERVLRHSPVPVLMFPAAALERSRTQVSGEMIDFRELNGGDCKSYLIVAKNRTAMVVDPLLENAEKVAAEVTGRKLTVKYVVDTHVHADHISGGPWLAAELGATYVVHENSGSSCAGMRVSHGDILSLGGSARGFSTPRVTHLMRSAFSFLIVCLRATSFS